MTEIEITDGGDKIIGKNRGIINSNEEITIEADEFEFDKKKNILKAKGNILIIDRINGYNFSAQEIIYNINQERIELKGKAEATIDNDYKFSSQNIIILRNEMIIISDVGASIIDNINQTLYELGKFSYSLKEETLKGEKIFIHSKYNQPFSDKYFFKSAVFNLKNQNYIAQDINIDFKKIYLVTRIMIQDLKGFPHQVKMVSQRSIKVSLQVVKKMGVHLDYSG